MTLFRTTLFAITALTLAACASDDNNTEVFTRANKASTQEVTDSNGNPALLISCAQPFVNCMNEAKRVCPNGFEGRKLEAAQIPNIVQNISSRSMHGFGSGSGAPQYRSMLNALVYCKNG